MLPEIYFSEKMGCFFSPTAVTCYECSEILSKIALIKICQYGYKIEVRFFCNICANEYFKTDKFADVEQRNFAIVLERDRMPGDSHLILDFRVFFTVTKGYLESQRLSRQMVDTQCQETTDRTVYSSRESLAGARIGIHDPAALDLENERLKGLTLSEAITRPESPEDKVDVENVDAFLELLDAEMVLPTEGQKLKIEDNREGKENE